MIALPGELRVSRLPYVCYMNKGQSRRAHHSCEAMLSLDENSGSTRVFFFFQMVFGRSEALWNFGAYRSAGHECMEHGDPREEALGGVSAERREKGGEGKGLVQG